MMENMGINKNKIEECNDDTVIVKLSGSG